MSAVDTTTGEVVEQCDEHRARDLTDKIKTSLGVAWELVKDAYRERAWAALGYRSWDEYRDEEFRGVSLRPPREERPEVVRSMREMGMSLRAIATATDTSPRTVSRELSGVANATPEPTSDDLEWEGRCDDCPERFAVDVWHCPECDHHWPHYQDECKNCLSFTADPPKAPKVTGTDGKQYPAAPPKPPAPPQPKRRALPDQFFDAAFDLTKKVEAVHRLTEDDRFPSNREKVAAKHRSDLLEAKDLLQQVIDRLPEG